MEHSVAASCLLSLLANNDTVASPQEVRTVKGNVKYDASYDKDNKRTATSGSGTRVADHPFRSNGEAFISLLHTSSVLKHMLVNYKTR